MMADEGKNEQAAPVEEAIKPLPVRIKPAEGEEIVLNEFELAVLVVLDQRTGAPIVYNVQNCPLRAFAKMMLNEALDLYRLTSQANTTVATFEKRLGEANAKKSGSRIETPFDGK